MGALADYLQSLPQRIRQLPSWFWRAKRLWLFVSAVVVSFVAADWVGSCRGIPRVDRLVWAGWALELLGVGMIAAAIWSKERRFGRPGLLKTAHDWVVSMPVWQRTRVVNISGSARLSLSGLRARIEGYQTPQSADLEARVASLEYNLKHLRENARREFDEHEKNLGQLRKDLDAERGAREAQGQEAEKGLREALVGDVHLEHVSVFWVIFGLTAATVPSLITSLFGWVYAFDFVPSCR